MSDIKKQAVNDSSDAIQVNGICVGTPFTELKTIFMDLFQLNFPKMQEVAAITAQHRMDEMFEQLRFALELHKDDIDRRRFVEPAIQFEIQNIAVDVARKGDKSNMELLCELLCMLVSKDCPDLLELIAFEARRVAPMLNKRHLSYLSLFALLSAKFDNLTPKEIDIILGEILEHLKLANGISYNDRQYLISIGCMAHRGVGTGNRRPYFANKGEEFKDVLIGDKYLDFCKRNELNNIAKLSELIECGQLGYHFVTATGRLIGKLNLRMFNLCFNEVT